MSNPWTPGPWPYGYTGDGKRITIGKGLVDGPNGYEVAEVYSDDCDQNEAEANARLIAAAPEMADMLALAEGAMGNMDAARHIRALLRRIRGETT